MKVGPVVPNKLFSIAFALSLLLGWLLYSYEQNRPSRELVEVMNEVQEERCLLLFKLDQEKEFDTPRFKNTGILGSTRQLASAGLLQPM